MKKIITTAIATLILAVCAHQSQSATLYYWGDYHKLQYQALDGKASLEEQIAGMEKYFIDAANHHCKPAPGAHAHLGCSMHRPATAPVLKLSLKKKKPLFPNQQLI